MKFSAPMTPSAPVRERTRAHALLFMYKAVKPAPPAEARRVKRAHMGNSSTIHRVCSQARSSGVPCASSARGHRPRALVSASAVGQARRLQTRHQSVCARAPAGAPAPCGLPLKARTPARFLRSSGAAYGRAVHNARPSARRGQPPARNPVAKKAKKARVNYRGASAPPLLFWLFPLRRAGPLSPRQLGGSAARCAAARQLVPSLPPLPRA